MHWYLVLVTHSIVFQGAVSGLLAAAIVDFHAFLAWKNAHDFVTYDWGTALFRWAQGAVTGALIAGGVFAIAPTS